MSLDPRVNRIQPLAEIEPIKKHEHWPTWEVFHQKKRGGQPVHVGIVHAPEPDLALVLAKEQYARRFKSVNLWVVKTTNIFTFRHEDEDMFETTTDKVHRDGNYYKVREKIEAYKSDQDKKDESISDTYFGGIKYD